MTNISKTNSLLEALIEAQNGNKKMFHSLIDSAYEEGYDIYADILDLLEKQREKCAEDVEIDHSSYYVKKSILNAKLIETQNKQ